ncbi:hypothetical protein BGZ98_004816, partial [Dissophora globulifera]
MDNRHLFEFLQRPQSLDKDIAVGDMLVRERESEETLVGPEQDGDPAIDESSFVKNCHLIKVLKFSEKSDLAATYLASLRLQDPSQIYNELLHPSTIVRLCNGLRGLHTLVVRPSLAISQDKAVLSQYFRLLSSIISRCSHFHTLDIRTSASLLSSDMLHEIGRVRRMGLRELRLACDFEGAELLIFQHLIEGTLQMIPLEPFNSSNMTLVNQIKARNFFCPDLRTLYFHNIEPVTRRRKPFFQLLSQDEPMEKLIPLTSLTILNFHTGCRFEGFGIEPFNWQAYHIIDPLLAILRLCPSLTHLRVSYDITLAEQPGPVGFTRMVRTLYPYHHITNWGQAANDFINRFKDLVPLLKNIDFGMRPHFQQRTWRLLMESYRLQLEALSVWSALGFDAHALTFLVGHPLGHPHRLNWPHRLTKLDINGLDATAKSAWLVFQQIPSLKDFSARDVPLNASRLVGYDWVCTGLQSLAIYVAVPKEPARGETTWTWIDENLEWEARYKTSSVVASVDGQDQQRMQTSKQDQSKPAPQQWHDYSTHLQIQVCEQLRRLTDLRRLILE